MSEQMKDNPYFAEHLLYSPDERSVPVMLAAVAHEQHTANLIAVYNTPNLRAYLDDAEGIALETIILQRLGIKDA